MDRLGDIVGVCQMVQLRVEKVIHAKCHLRKEPIILLVHRRVSEVRSHIGLDRQGKKVPRRGMNEKICRACGGPSPWSLRVWRLIGVIGHKQSTVDVKITKGFTSGQLPNDHVGKGEWQITTLRMHTSHHIGIQREPRH